jgi:hypothetical protein
MENILEQDIINAIIALDAQKIEKIRKSLRDQLRELHVQSTKFQRVVSILSAAGYHDHEEYTKHCILIDNTSKEIQDLQALIEQCNCALREFNK